MAHYYIKRFLENWHSPRVLIQLFAIMSLGVILTLEWLSPMGVNYKLFFAAYIFAFVFYILAAIIHLRKIHGLAIALEALGAAFLLTKAVLIGTYLAMSLNMPLADAELAAMDMAIGVDWKAIVYWVNDYPLLSHVLKLAYASYTFQLMIVPLLLGICKMPDRAIAMVASYAILCFISTFISIWYPAIAAYETFGFVPADVPNIATKFGYYYLEEFHSVRNDPNFILGMKPTAGIVTFPSIHAGTGILLIWATWPLKVIRIPFIIFNLLMCLSAVTHGSHYVVDVIAGVGVAGITIAIVNAVFLKKRIYFKPNLANSLAESDLKAK